MSYHPSQSTHNCQCNSKPCHVIHYKASEPLLYLIHGYLSLDKSTLATYLISLSRDHETNLPNSYLFLPFSVWASIILCECWLGYMNKYLFITKKAPCKDQRNDSNQD